MKEIRDIISSHARAAAAGKRAALATVVQVEGSSYRRPGARMLVTDDGQLTGAISGGCLEGDALRKALLAISQGANKLVTYDTSDEDDAKFGVQLGCNGIVHILFEPINNEDTSSPIRLLQQVAGQSGGATLVTLFSLDTAAQPGTSLLYGEGMTNQFSDALTPVAAKTKQGPTPHRPLHALPAHAENNDPTRWSVPAQVSGKPFTRGSAPPELQHLLARDMQDSFALKKSFFRNPLTDSLQAFIEYIPAPVSLLVAGAGNDILPLVSLSSMLGWEITVIDGRATHANRQRFSGVHRVEVVKMDQLHRLTFQPGSVALLMSHNYNYDYTLLKELLQRDLAYIGILGPSSKFRRMRDQMLDEGFEPESDQLDKVHAPMGIDIGAETAEEIAVSVIAEIKAVLGEVKVLPLREKQTPIHHRPTSHNG